MNRSEQMEKALEAIRDAATCGGSDFGNPAIRALLDQMDMIRAKAQSALALTAPPRNCDVGTAEEQTERFEDFCEQEKSGVKDYSHIGPVCDDCAIKAGFWPKNKIVGVWMDECGICHQQKPCTDLHHDWHPPKKMKGKAK